jgi:prepilin-type N-terminal cleavage/methylation domain-containing protein/prepilin-type processing-associated H-X9-DG protein
MFIFRYRLTGAFSMQRKRERNAFTLVELLVVIGIIAVLIAILLPALAAARKAAQAAACMSNMRQWGMALQAYVDQNKGALPQKGPSGQQSSPIGPYKPTDPNACYVTGLDDPSLWYNALPPYMNQTAYADMINLWVTGGPPPPYPGGGASIWICPSSLSPSVRIPPPSGGPPDVLFVSAGPPTSTYPVVAEPRYYTLSGSTKVGKPGGKGFTGSFPFFSSYAFNSKLLQVYSNGNNVTPSGPPKINMSQIAPSSEVVTMTEKVAFAGETAATNDAAVQEWITNAPTYAQENAGTNVFIDQYGATSNVSQPGADWTRFTTRHNHGGHLLFADGHVQWFQWPEVQVGRDQYSLGQNQWDWNQHGKVVWSALGPVQ